MIAVDTNVLVYAHRRDAPFHERAFEAMRCLAEGNNAWILLWPCVHEFLSKVTHPRIFTKPTSLERAIEQVTEWVRSPTARLLTEPDGYLDVLARVLIQSQVNGSKVHDARIAALCIAHGVTELWTADRDFGRFHGFRTRNPF